jgi:hypothetical protein
VLRRGTFAVVAAAGSMIAWTMTRGDAAALVVLNNADAPATLAVPAGELAGVTLTPVGLPGDAAPPPLSLPADPAAAVHLTLPARAGRVYLR